MHIVSLTFDDGLDVHLDCVVPLLERHGLTGTFFVTTGASSFRARRGDWGSVVARGHELGNHTVLHPAVRGKAYVTEDNDIERYSLERMRQELEAASRCLAELDGRSDRTFAYPCCTSVLGRPGILKRALRWARLDRTRLMAWVQRHPALDVGTSERSYESVASSLFVAARTGGERYSAGEGYPPPRWMVPCVSLDGRTWGDVQALLDSFVREECGWLVFVAHGVDGGHRLSCDRAVFETLLAELRNPGVSVQTFRAAAQAIYRK